MSSFFRAGVAFVVVLLLAAAMISALHALFAQHVWTVAATTTTGDIDTSFSLSDRLDWIAHDLVAPTTRQLWIVGALAITLIAVTLFAPDAKARSGLFIGLSGVVVLAVAVWLIPGCFSAPWDSRFVAEALAAGLVGALSGAVFALLMRRV